MNRNRKNLHKAAVNMLGFTLASVMAAGTVGELAAPVSVFAAQTESKETGRTVYLNGSEKAIEHADGSTPANAVASLKEALKLVGRQGEILVCGTVVIDSEIKITIPAEVTIKPVNGFDGKLFKIKGKGALLVTGKEISKEYVDVSSAEAGENAFQIIKDKDSEEKPEEPKEPETVPEEKPEEPKEPETVPEEPKEPETVPEEKPEEPKEPETVPEEKPEEPKEPETVPEEKPEEPKEPETVPEEKPEEPKEPETVPEEKPEEPKEPETAPEEPEVKKPGIVEVPEKLVFKTVEEFRSFDFEENGFAGEGTFAWEEEIPQKYETQIRVRFTPENPETYDYTQVEGWENETKTVIRSVKIYIEDLKPADQSEEQDQKPVEESKKPEEEQKEEVIITPAEPDVVPEKEPEQQKDETPVITAKPGKLGEVAKEIPEAIPVGSLIDESGVQVSADFLPFYVDLQVSYNEAVSELPDAGIGEILSAYELKLWDLKEDKEYRIPEGRKVKVMIPLPENADCYSDLAIAHYLGNNEYEYFIFDKDGKLGNMTIEEKDGTEYLAFETASFSPFNVGGHQIVGPGINSSGHKPSVGQNGGTGTAGGTQNQNSTGNTSGTDHTGESSQNGTGSASPQKKPNQTTSGGNNTTVVIRPVKTGDSTETAVYVALGAGAVLLGLGTVAAGKKKE